jgi:hypothetical protein
MRPTMCPSRTAGHGYNHSDCCRPAAAQHGGRALRDVDGVRSPGRGSSHCVGALPLHGVCHAIGRASAPGNLDRWLDLLGYPPDIFGMAQAWSSSGRGARHPRVSSFRGAVVRSSSRSRTAQPSCGRCPDAGHERQHGFALHVADCAVLVGTRLFSRHVVSQGRVMRPDHASERTAEDMLGSSATLPRSSAQHGVGALSCNCVTS